MSLSIGTTANQAIHLDEPRNSGTSTDGLHAAIVGATRFRLRRLNDSLVGCVLPMWSRSPAGRWRQLRREPTEPRSFEVFFLEQRARLFGTLCLITGHAAEAEELMQESFVRVWERWDRLSAHPDPTGYLYRTALNMFRSRARRAARATRRVLSMESSTDPFPGVEDRHDLLDALRRLPPRQRAALILTELQDLSSEEAGKVLGIKPVTVRVLASQARARLKSHMGEPMNDLRPVLERLRDQLAPPSGGLEQLIAFRDRRRRRQRLGAALLAMVVALAGLGFAILAFRSDPRIQQPLPAAPASNGLIAYAGGPYGGAQIITMEPDGSQRTAITSGGGEGSPAHPYPAYEPAWSPDGSRIAFRGFWGHGEESDLFVMNADGSAVRQLTTNGAEQPSWSPDGTKIAFGTWNGIYIINADGTGLRRLTPESGLWHDHPTWAPDGGRIAYVMPVDGTFQIFSIATDGTDVRQLTNLPNGAISPSWSPDGSQMAFVHLDSSGGSDIYVMNPDGEGMTPATACAPPDCKNDFTPAWSPDGTRLLFVREGDIYSVAPDGSGLANITNDQAGYESPSWQPVPFDEGSPSPPLALHASVAGRIDVGRPLGRSQPPTARSG